MVKTAAPEKREAPPFSDPVLAFQTHLSLPSLCLCSSQATQHSVATARKASIYVSS